MNCLGFRRALSTRPASEDREVLLHRQECADCDAFARRQAAFERTLAEAVKLPVPEGLAARLLVAHGVEVEAGRRARWRRVAAAAATIVGVGLGSWFAVEPESLDRSVLSHIESERSHLADRRDLSPAQVNQVLAPVGIEVGADVGPVHYAGTCRIRRSLGAHLVLQGEKGPVTVLFMPDDSVDARLDVTHAQFQGVIVPVRRGSMAIVGAPGEALKRIEWRLRRAVRFAARVRSAGRRNV